LAAVAIAAPQGFLENDPEFIRAQAEGLMFDVSVL